jgi:4-hydroxybenzoate polyprenyltransferase
VAPTLASASETLPPLLRVLRIHQWAKNFLLFLPVLAAHHVGDRQAMVRVGLAFLSFGLVASSVYVVNDLLDVESDRHHARKRRRPFASGALRPATVYWLAPLLLVTGAGIAASLPTSFQVLLAAYWLTSFTYSLWFKRVAVLDVLVLGALYTARIYAGAFAAVVPVSEWLASFSLFFFFSLAILKRASEIGRSLEAPRGRGYRPDDRVLLTALGVASGYVSVLVLALYVNNPDVTRLYSRPSWLWALCVLALYWLSRAWLLAWRGEVDDDPVVFAFRDPVSWTVVALGGVALYLGA